MRRRSGCACAGEDRRTAGGRSRRRRDHLTIEDRLVDAKLGHHVVTEGRGDLLAQRIEPGEGIPSSRDKAAAPALDIAHRAKPIVFRIEQPVRVVERLLAPGWRDWLYPRKWRMWRILGVSYLRAPSRIWSGAGPVLPTPASPAYSTNRPRVRRCARTERTSLSTPLTSSSGTSNTLRESLNGRPAIGQQGGRGKQGFTDRFAPAHSLAQRVERG